MLRSKSNLLRRTHWWNVQSSMAMDCFPLLGYKHRHTWEGEQINLPVVTALFEYNSNSARPSPSATLSVKEGIQTEE